MKHNISPSLQRHTAALHLKLRVQHAVSLRTSVLTAQDRCAVVLPFCRVRWTRTGVVEVALYVERKLGIDSFAAKSIASKRCQRRHFSAASAIVCVTTVVSGDTLRRRKNPELIALARSVIQSERVTAKLTWHRW